jgi:hypothetical protein
MRFAKPFLLVSALALAFGAYAADDKSKQAKADAEPGFNNLDTNDDGKLSKAEAAKDSKLTANWAEADRNNDGSITRAEYLMVKGKQDIGSLTDRVKSATSDDKGSSSAGASSSAGSGSSAGSTGKSK